MLWGDLGIGLLVLLAGSFLVPALSLPQALGAILVGSVIGVTLLGLTGIVGSQTGLPTMVCLRPALGRGGSYVATGINVVQLLGWTVFELVIMGHAANAVVRGLTGFDAAWLWIVAFGAAVIALGLWGPVAVVREWLTKFALGAVVVTTGWLTWRLLDPRRPRGALGRSRGRGPLVLGGGGHRDRDADLVAAARLGLQPLSPGVRRPAFWGTTAGYLVANVWFYSLGALILLTMGTSYDPKAFVEAIALLAGPADPAGAARRRDRRGLGRSLLVRGLDPERLPAGVGPAGWWRGSAPCRSSLALVFDVTRYEGFLLLIGAVFVPLFGVLVADYFVVRRRPVRPVGAPRRDAAPAASCPVSAGKACSPGRWASRPIS